MKYSSAKPIIQKKIERNNYLIQLFELENKMAKIEMVIKLRVLKHNQLYINDLNEINKVETEQAIHYTLLRENRIRELTIEANTRKIDIDDLKNEIDECNNKIKTIIDKINSLNAHIIPINYVVNVDTDLGLQEYQKKCNYN